MFDVERARADTPACTEIIHLNSAGSALPPQPVLRTVVGHLEREARMGGYEAEDAAQEQLTSVYGSIARLLGCSPGEIALMENATRAWDSAFYGIRFRSGDRILTSRAEYASNVVAFLQTAERHDVCVEVVPDDESGQLSVAALESMLDERVALVAVTHVPTHGGLVNPAADIGRVTREADVPYLLDACQSVGQMPVDVAEIGCDMLSATGRKFLRGPRGTGFLYVARGFLERLDPPMLDLHGAPWSAPDAFTMRPDTRRFETWEGYVAGRLGLGAAVDYALGWGLPAIRDRLEGLAARLRGGLSDIPGVRVHDAGERRCAIVTFTVAGVDPPEVVRHLAEHRVVVNHATASASRFDLPERDLDALVRASVHYVVLEEEVDRVCQLVAALARSAR